MDANNTRLNMLIYSIALLVLFGLPAILHAEFYKFTDDTGKTVFVDDIGKIPEIYRDQIKTYKEQYDDLSEEERQRMIEKERQNQKTDVIIKENKILVPVWLGSNGNEIKALLLLDTGASIVTLHDDVAEKLNFENLEQARARVAGGKEVTFNVANLDYISVGPYEKSNILVGILTLEGQTVDYDGLLGMNFLQHFSYDIDFEEQKIQWTLK